MIRRSRSGRALVAGGAAVLCASIVVGGAGAAPGDATATRVADIETGPTGSSPVDIIGVGGTAFFGATDAAAGTELWKSTGGPLGLGGTEIVADINPGGGGAGGSNPSEMTNIAGTVLFAAQDNTAGKELWKTVPPYDAGATTRVEDINVTPDPTASSSPEGLVNVNGTLFFTADDGIAGAELWKSAPPYDASTTEMVMNIDGGGGDSFPQELTGVGDDLFFTADDGVSGYELWRSAAPYDAATTELVENINSNPTPEAPSNPMELTDVGGTLFFTADDGVNGTELWMSASPYNDGTTNVVQIDPSAVGSDPGDLVDVGGTLFFAADNGTDGDELWKLPLPFTTPALIDINPGSGDSSPQEMTDVGGTIYFRAGDGANGIELWKSDGGPPGAGTEMVADIRVPASSSPAAFTNVNGTVFFRANDGVTGSELWKTTGVGATRVGDINPGSADSSPDSLTELAGALFFSATDGSSGRELWKATIEGPAAPVATPVQAVPAVPAKKAKKCKKKKAKRRASAAAKKKKKKCKKKRKK
jgi:ELWxxDGT repeat protein